jgi:3-isopropylmalate/(R)-2-methylmalate dehydratase small subunit
VFRVDPFARHCLLNGVDELGFLLGQDAAIAAYESTHSSRVCTR